MIPKKIHYCWLSNDPFPKKTREYMDTWQKTHPDYEIKRWSTKNFDVNSVPYVKEHMKPGNGLSLLIISVCMPFIPRAASIWTPTCCC